MKKHPNFSDMEENENNHPELTPLTWEKLESFIKQLSPEARKQMVCVQLGDGERPVEVDFETTKTDIWVNKFDDDDCGSLEELKQIYGDEFNESDYEFATAKGTPYLFTGKFLTP